jgi:hypothetical protein
MIRPVLILILLLILSSCEQRTVVRLEGGNPPTFSVTGSGRLGEIIVFGPEQEQITDAFDTTHALWEVVAENEDSAPLLEELGEIRYGVVPRGYKQIKPESGAAQPLSVGKRYRYWFITVNAPHAAGYFEIRDGKAIPVAGP